MPHLDKLRKGWENEHLATFLLSRISFVANPIKVADDIGTDLFCTLFEIATGQLFPRSSFAIQLKSSTGGFDVTGQLDYFERLELPFLVGVVDQKNLRLSIYSGEYVPILFSHLGRPRRLNILPIDGPVTFEDYYEDKSNEHYVLRMPHILDLEVRENRESAGCKSQLLLQLCSRMHQNISTKAICEYVFKLGDGRVVVFAGPGSNLTFRENFYYRLIEAFRNLDWLFRSNPQTFPNHEYEIYERCYLDLKRTVQIPIELTAAYHALRQRLETPPN
jgi:hypothetical protein